MIRSSPATFQAYYNEPYNALVKPHRFLCYFRQRWMRELGPLGTLIVLHLRGLCYYNPDKGELRDICEVRMEEIAEAVGVSRATVARELSDKASGEPVNPALRRFVMRQQQYNLTEKGIRRAATLYHVSMDDPIHPEDELQYALLSRQFLERQSAREEGPLKPKIRRSEPKSQIETLESSFDGSKSHFETLATGRESQNETTYKESLYPSLHSSLNVSARVDPGQGQRSTSNASGGGMLTLREKAVEELITLTGDDGSRRRFEQLWGIAEGREALDAWKAALRAVKRRMEATGKEPLERPGAYFDSTCVRELEKRQIFVPTREEKQSQKDVAEVIRQDLFQESSIPEQAAVASVVKPSNIEPRVGTRAVETAETPARLEEELLQLEREGGAPWEAFQSFVTAEKARYAAELGMVSSTARERLLTAFDRSEKRRSLLRAWKATGGDRAK